MEQKEKNIELRSEKVRAIVGRIPSALLRYGTVVIVVVVLLLFAIAYWLPYRNVYTGQVTFFEAHGGTVEVKMAFEGKRFPNAVTGRTPSLIIGSDSISVAATLLSLSQSCDTLGRQWATVRLDEVDTARFSLLRNRTFTFTLVEEYDNIILKVVGE